MTQLVIRLRALYYQEECRKLYLEQERLRERIPEHEVFKSMVIDEQRQLRTASSKMRGALFEILRQQGIR